MRTLVFVAMAAGLAWSAGEYVAVDPSEPPTATPSYLLSTELSRDNGNITNAWCYLNGAGTYVGCQYDTPADMKYLTGIKYYVWNGWPDTTFQGFAVACWAIEGGTPGSVVWPTDGNPIWNANTGGNWIIQTVDPWFNLFTGAPNGFLVGIGFLYTYPAIDAFGIDNTGAGPYDWVYASGAWGAPPGSPPYGKGTARALVSSGSTPPWWAVEPSTLGTLRALYR